MDPNQISLFAMAESHAFGERVSASLGVDLSPLEERSFEDGEVKARPLVNVRSKDVFVIHSLYGDPDASVHDKLCRLLFFIGALKDAAARRVTAVVPYLCYSRKDRKTKPRDPVTARYVAELFEAVGADRFVTIDVHNLSSYQNAFRIGADHLEANGLFVRYFAALLEDEPVAVVSPDAGGVKRASVFRQVLTEAIGRAPTSVFLEKLRSEGIVTGDAVVGDVDGRTAIIIDDLISTGTTIFRAAKACRAAGARQVYAAATHGLFVSGADEVVRDAAFQKVVITDTIPPFRLSPDVVGAKVEVLDTAPLFAESIRRIHSGGSIVELLEG